MKRKATDDGTEEIAAKKMKHWKASFRTLFTGGLLVAKCEMVPSCFSAVFHPGPYQSFHKDYQLADRCSFSTFSPCLDDSHASKPKDQPEKSDDPQHREVT